MQVAANFHFPEFTEDNQPLAVSLDNNSYAYDALWLKSGLEVRKATHLHRAVSNGPPASKVVQYVKYLSDAEPKDGRPAYSIHHPGPDIAKPETILNGKFFGGPGFAIWMERGHHGPVCRPIFPPSN